MARKKLSLGEKIALAATGGAQEDEFPEDIEYDTSAKVVDISDDEQEDAKRPVRSSLRTKNAPLLDELDERYTGQKVSRKKLAKDDGLSKLSLSSKSLSSGTEDEGIEGSQDELDDEGASLSEDESVVGADASVVRSPEEEEDLSEDMSGSEDEEEDEVEGDESEDKSDNEDEETSGVQTLSARDHQSEIEKGKATLNQIRIWDSLLEVRIRLQKMLLDCNRLPYANSFKEIMDGIKTLDSSSTTVKLLEKSQEATKVLMFELLRLQEVMMQKNSETRNGLKIARAGEESGENPVDGEITSESESEELHENKDSRTESIRRKRKINPEDIITEAKKTKLGEFQSSAGNFFENFIPYRNQIVQKWNDKTQFAGGKYNKKASQQISTLRQIEQILGNKERLLKRTQVRRSNYAIIGATAKPTNTEEPTTEPGKEVDDEAELDPEIFDDDDFYHQLLRELIERKTSNVNDPIQLSQHWLELQKLRTKLKRKVDTRASKGRKIRYDVHSKLVNFMAPQDNCKMSLSAVQELFSSLFGKTKD